jgi:hypothetical protein
MELRIGDGVVRLQGKARIAFHHDVVLVAIRGH